MTATSWDMAVVRYPLGPKLITAALLAACLGRAGGAEASTMLALDLAELTARADDVVLATVIGARAEPARGLIVTRVLVRVEVTVAGRSGPADELEVIVPGGELDGLGLLVQGAPRLEPGRRYLLFLERTNPSFRVVGMAQGAMPVEEDRRGRLLVEPPEGLPGLVRPVGGRLVPALPAVSAATLLDEVTARVREVRADGR